MGLAVAYWRWETFCPSKSCSIFSGMKETRARHWAMEWNERSPGNGITTSFYGDTNGNLFISPFGSCPMESEIRWVALIKAYSCKCSARPWPPSWWFSLSERRCHQGQVLGSAIFEQINSFWLPSKLAKIRHSNGDWSRLTRSMCPLEKDICEAYSEIW